ncbi:hypothetical protein OWV82_011261 [Melia azedarach]|uniref:Uncharacterized protein n=1 Tax=Melia azedarach TaxID=155640 RepID=A0ACC1XYJ0_MELAZ|nr:hypothetical protein OWV82_011261 [Melia azedarach]
MERNWNSGRNGNHDIGPITAEADLQNWLRGMQRKIGKMPTLLSETAGSDACCIFRVPESLVEINAKAYKPRIVSIGPYHHGQEHLRMIQEHKWRFLRALLTRKEDDHGAIISHCFQAVASLEMNIRECYSDQTNKFSGQDFVEMMVLDGCFIIELVCKFTELVEKDPDDPIFKMDWVIPFLMRDLLKLENQIPFFVLQILFDLLVLNSRRSFACLALKFFSYMLERPPQVLDGANGFHGKHLLDLVRLSFCLPNKERLRGDTRDKLLRFIQPAEKLHRAGIKFKTRNDADSFLDIKFSNGVLGVPPLPMDDFISSFLLNCVAFEQCHANSHKYITDYATFMGCLVHTPSDAGFLCDHKIIQNCFGTDDEVACFFSNVGKDVAIDIRKSYLSRLIEDVNEYYWNDWHVRWASFRHKYFDSPWSFMSACAALLLLILTSIQTFFAAFSYVRPAN